MSVVVELRGLELPGRHGVLDDGSARPSSRSSTTSSSSCRSRARTSSRRPSTTARSSSSCASVSDERQFQLLESLAAAVADALLERFPVERVRVRVRKPEVELGAPVEYAAASVRRARR